MTTDSKSPAQLLVEERTGRDIDGLLRELYVDRRFGDQEIADYLRLTHRLAFSRTAINQWRDQFGISRADRIVADAPIETAS